MMRGFQEIRKKPGGMSSLCYVPSALGAQGSSRNLVSAYSKNYEKRSNTGTHLGLGAKCNDPFWQF